jgi:hypothetical protein
MAGIDSKKILEKCREGERKKIDLNKIQILNFLFFKAKPFKLFFVAMQGWVGISPILLQLLIQHSYL